MFLPMAIHVLLLLSCVQNSQKTFPRDHGLGWKGIRDRMHSMHQSSLLKFTYHQLQQSFKEHCKVFHFLFRPGGRIAIAQLDRKAHWEKSDSKITRNNT